MSVEWNERIMAEQKGRRLLVLSDVAERSRQSEATIRWLIHVKRMPAPGKIGRRLVWRESDIDAWIDSQFEERDKGVVA